MRPALIAVLLAASALAGGCVDLEEEGSTATPVEAPLPDNADVIAASLAPPEQVASCVEQIKFGAFTGDAVWSEVWNNVGQTDDGASAHCTQLLSLIHI